MEGSGQGPDDSLTSLVKLGTEINDDDQKEAPAGSTVGDPPKSEVREETKEQTAHEAMDASLIQKFRKLVALKGDEYTALRDELLADTRLNVDELVEHLQKEETEELTWQQRLTVSILRVGLTEHGKDLREEVLAYMRGELNEVKKRRPPSMWGYWTAHVRGNVLAKLGPSALPLVIECLWKTRDYAIDDAKERSERLAGLFYGLHDLVKEEATGGDVQGRDVALLELELFDHSEHDDPLMRGEAATSLGTTPDLVSKNDTIIQDVARTLHNALFAQVVQNDKLSEELKLVVVGAMKRLCVARSVRAQVFDDMLAVIKNNQFPVRVRDSSACFIKNDDPSRTIEALNAYLPALRAEVSQDKTVEPVLDAVLYKLEQVSENSKK